MKAIGDVQRHEGGGPLAFRKVIQWKGSPVGRFAALGSYAHRCGAHNQWLITGEEITRMITLLKLLLRRRKLLHCDARRARVHKQALPHVLVRGGRAQFSARVSHFFTGAHNSESSSVMTGLDLDSDRLIETLRAAAATRNWDVRDEYCLKSRGGCLPRRRPPNSNSIYIYNIYIYIIVKNPWSDQT